MRRFTKIKVIAVFVVALVIIASAYWITSKSLVSLIETVRESSKPNFVLIKAKEINADITGAESGVRAFALTQNEKYLEPYLDLVSNIDKKLDTLRVLTKEKPYEASAIDSIAALMKNKMAVYKDLLSIRYSSVLDSTFGKISGNFISSDSSVKETASVDSTQQNAETKKGWLKKLFSGNPSKKDLMEKELNAKADAALKENEKSKKQISEVKRTIAEIKEKETEHLKLQIENELNLLDRDKDITHEIENLIRKIEFDESLQLQHKAEEANETAARSGNLIKMLVSAGSLVLLLMMTLIIYDIAKSNLYRKQLTEAKAHAEKLAKIKEEFLANMSHEIRTPLSAILGYTGRILKSNLSDRQTDYANAINASSEHLLSIVNDILDLTKLETGNLNLEKITFKPDAVVKEVMDVMLFKADEKKISLKYDIEEIKNITVKGDPVRLKQVLYNLIGNAIKFTEKGNVKLEVGSWKLDNSIPKTSNFRFQISDTGIGIPEEKLKTIFAQFSQADSSITRKFGGTGLGLNISKKIIELLGGAIEVKSELLKGSDFIFIIPYEMESTAASQQLADEQASTSSFKLPASKILSGIKILLAEDTELNRILQKEMLLDLGAEVTEAQDGLEVVAYCELPGAEYQLILMDVQMPKMSGIEALKEIREKLRSTIPVIAMTANVMQHDLDRYLKAGFNDCITKPFKENELAEKILGVLNGKTSFFLQTPEQESSLSSDALYDLDELKKSSKGNADFVIRMLKIFLSSSESLLEKAKLNAAEKKWEDLSGNAHRLIPSCKYISINTMAADLKKIEDLCNTQPDEIKIKELLTNVTKEHEKVKTALLKEINNFEKSFLTSNLNPSNLNQ
ncbi:MAG: ATP-binding protein [Bacteroidia bacterium]